MIKLHPRAVWLFFINSLFGWLVAFLIFGWWIPVMFAEADVEFNFLASIRNSLFIFVLLLVGLSYLFARLSYHFYSYELTDLGFKKEYGIIWKKYVTIPYDRIQNVDIYRGIWARILGLSDLQIQTAGMSYNGRGGAGTEGRLPGLSKGVAEQLRDDLITRSRHARTNSQGL